MKLSRVLRPSAIVGTFISGALATFLALPRTELVVLELYSGSVFDPNNPGGSRTAEVQLDPPWMVMLIVGLVAASLAYWLTGRIADTRDRS